MDIKQEIQKENAHAVRRVRMTRYIAAAAAVVLVLGGALGFFLTRGNSGKTSLENNASASAAVLDATAPAAAADAAALEAIAEAVEETAPAAGVKIATTPDAVTTAESYDALYAYMDTLVGDSRKRAMLTSGAMPETAVSTDMADGATASAAAAEPAAAADMGGAGGDSYSETNVQVAGVDEADIVKTDGKFIYYIANSQLSILEAGGKDTKRLSVTPLSSDDGWWGYASELYLAGDRLFVITQGMSVVKVTSGGSSYDDNRDMTEVRVYDVADRAKPVLLTTLAQSGSYLSSRMVNDMVYIVTSQYIWQPVRSMPATFVPETRANGVSATVAANDIYLYGQPKNMAYTVIGAIDTGAPTAYAGVKAVFGSTGELYCNGESLLLACSEYEETVSDIAPDETGRNVQVTTSQSSTKLMLFSLDGAKIALSAHGVVPGTLLNQFAMDAYKGVYRIVTNLNEWTQRIYTDGVDTYEYEDSTSNGLYTFDENLQLLGSLTGLAKDEYVKSVRFDGDIAYFVTFRQVDPLFTVDLSNSARPTLLGSLKIPGFSEYLHVFGKNNLLGIGYAADEKTGRTQGVKLSMFDLSDKKNVTEAHTQLVGADWSIAGSNHKAILVDPEKNLIAFPADSAYYIYSYSEKDGFTELAKVAMTTDLYSWNLRGLFIGEYFYVLSDSAFSIISMADWSTVATGKL